MPIKPYPSTGRIRKDKRVLRAVVRFAAKVAPLFELNGWKWQISGKPRVPTAQEIEETLLELVDHLDAQSAESTERETGRLRARRGPDGMWRLELVPETEWLHLPDLKPEPGPTLRIAGEA